MKWMWITKWQRKDMIISTLKETTITTGTRIIVFITTPIIPEPGGKFPFSLDLPWQLQLSLA